MNKDWIELLELLAENQVEYLVIGAWAMAYHGQPRYTGDLDLFFEPTQNNAHALLRCLRQFGTPTAHLSVDDLASTGLTVTFGTPPSRVDLLNWMSGITFEDAVSDSVAGEMFGVPVRYLSKRALIKNKVAAGRPKDIADLTVIEDSQA